jgi:uncharacterized protein YjbI with pentapeptide repeats/endonuclease YncB( thermonuclease family)
VASRAPTTEEKAAALGRSVVVGLFVTIGLAWVGHQGEVRDKREALARSLVGGTDFRGIDLHDRDLAGFYLAGKDFSDADLHGADLRDTNLRGATLKGANLSDADLAGADLREAKLDGADTNLRSASLAGADLTRAELRSVELREANLERANLSGTTLEGADLRDANLREAVMPGAVLRRALLEADLRGAVLSADLRDAELEGADLRDAQWDDSTRWPPGFDPEAHMEEIAHEPVSPSIPSAARRDTVERVVDGDTIVLSRLGGVRLLGIDAPQADLRPEECYGSEATVLLQGLLPVGSGVRYTLGKAPRDSFNRALAYVWIRREDFVNLEIIKRGGATVLFTPPNLEYAALLRDATVWAAMNRRGLWSEC